MLTRGGPSPSVSKRTLMPAWRSVPNNWAAAMTSAHTLSVSTVWRATVTMTGPGGIAAVPVDLDTAVLTATVVYPVVEVRTRLVA